MEKTLKNRISISEKTWQQKKVQEENRKRSMLVGNTGCEPEHKEARLHTQNSGAL